MRLHRQPDVIDLPGEAGHPVGVDKILVTIEVFMSGVGTQKVFENDRVIVWHLDLEPGERGATHTHKLDYVVRILSGSTLEVFGPTGELLDTIELESGGAVTFRVDGDQIHADRPGSPAVPTTHSARNIGPTTFREVLIEFKKSPTE